MPTLTLPGPWQQALADFLQCSFDRSGSAKSRDTYLSVLRCFFRDPLRSPASYTKSEVLEFLKSKSTSNRNYGADVSVSTRNSRLTALSSFFAFASDYEIDGRPLFTGKMPTAGIRHLKPEIKYRDIQADDFERVMAVIPDTPIGWRDRCIILLYFWLGRRRNELRFLRYGDIQASVIVDENGTRRNGHTYRYHGKGAQRQEKIQEMPASAYLALTTYLAQSGRLATIQPDDYLFVSMYTKSKQPLSGYRLCQIFQGYCKLAGLSREYSLHALRHLAARERYSAGVDLRSIQQYLGHTSLATTDIYLRRLAGVSDPGAALLSARFAHLSKF